MARRSALAREIQQGRPFSSPRHEAALGLLKTVDVLRGQLSRVLEPYGVTDQQYNVLRILRGAGAAGLPTLAVRDRLLEEAPGITRLLDKLERSGLVRRSRSTPDRRQVVCHATPSGLALLKRLDPLIGAADEAGAAGLRVSEQRALIQLLDRVRDRMREASRGQ